MAEQAEKPTRIVSFTAGMRASSAMSTEGRPAGNVIVLPPHARTEREAERLTPEELGRGTKGGIILMKILTMSVEERRQKAAEEVDDPIFMWFAFLTKEERREFLKAAEESFREKLME